MILEVKHIEKKFYDPVEFPVLKDVSFSVNRGEFLTLVGKSGCGKSTFIRTLNRMHEFIPTAALAGEVLLDGQDIYAPGTDVTKIRLRVGMVFQKPNPFPSMTIGENVLSGLKLAQLKKSNTDELLESCLVRAGLWSEVKGSTWRARRGTLGWTATAPMYRSRPSC